MTACESRDAVMGCTFFCLFLRKNGTRVWWLEMICEIRNDDCLIVPGVLGSRFEGL